MPSVGVGRGALPNQRPIRIKVDGPSGDDSATCSGSSSDSSNESDDESEKDRRKLRRPKTNSLSTNEPKTNSFFPTSPRQGNKRGGPQQLLHSASNSAITNNSLLTYRNNDSTFKTDEEDNATGPDKLTAIMSAGDKAQDSDSAQHSLMDSLINQTKQKFLPKSSKRKAEKLSKKQKKQEKEQRMKDEQERKLKTENGDQCDDVSQLASKTAKPVKGKAEITDNVEKNKNNNTLKTDIDEGSKVKDEKEKLEKAELDEKPENRKRGVPENDVNDRFNPHPTLRSGQNSLEVTPKENKDKLVSAKHNPSVRSLTPLEPLEALTTSTAETITTGASSTTGTGTTTSATDTNTDNTTTTEDEDDDDMPLAAKKHFRTNPGKRNRSKKESGAKLHKINMASDNDSQEETEISASYRSKIRDNVNVKSRQTNDHNGLTSNKKGAVASE